ncbi:MAG TPA: Na+/H+ antiporter NhaA [Acidobacteriaceae bacterium]
MASLAQRTERRRVQRLMEPFLRFAQLESAGSIVLLLATVAALLAANSPLGDAYESLLKLSAAVSHLSIHGFVNDGLMAIFFLLVGLEVKREFLSGELQSLRRALLPVVAALGGVVTPALLYLTLNFALNGARPAARGWGVPIATDVAFSLAVLGAFRGIPVGLKVFLVALAIVDDIAGVVVIAVVYTRHLRLEYLGIAAALFAFCVLLNWRGATRLRFYVPAGIALWWAMYMSGVHPTMAGILFALAVPGGDGKDESPASRLEQGLHPWVSFGIVPLFALVNAGIAVLGLDRDVLLHPIFLGVLAGLLLGKPLGITLFSWIAVRLRLAELPGGVNWRQLHAVSWLGGIGFTVSIFIAGLAFETEEQYTLARIAVLAASACAAAIGALALSGTRWAKTNPHSSNGSESTGIA